MSRKRSRIEIYLDNYERELLLDFFKYTKSFSRTSQLASFFMWRKGNPRKIDYRVVARWLRKLDPVMTEIVLKQREEQRTDLLYGYFTESKRRNNRVIRTYYNSNGNLKGRRIIKFK